jgi:LuxR family transcriptional regulator, quorum-sensing system regulator BjaR1
MHNLEAFLDDFDRAETFDGATEAVRWALVAFGCEHFTFQDLPDPSHYQDFLFCHRIPAEWLKLYVEKKYNTVDPAFRLVRRSTQPFVWSDAPYDPQLEPLAAEMVRRVIEFRLDRGLMVPVPRVGARPGVVWLGGQHLELGPRAIPRLQYIALYAFEKLRLLCRPAHEEKRLLTGRELEVLKWVAAGKTAWEIGEILNITMRTVNEHASSIMKKLGTSNRTHAVALAIRDHLIDL